MWLAIGDHLVRDETGAMSGAKRTERNASSLIIRPPVAAARPAKTSLAFPFAVPALARRTPAHLPHHRPSAAEAGPCGRPSQAHPPAKPEDGAASTTKDLLSAGYWKAVKGGMSRCRYRKLIPGNIDAAPSRVAVDAYPNSALVPLAGLEPALLAEPHFECGASTNFTTGARRLQRGASPKAKRRFLPSYFLSSFASVFAVALP